MNQNLVAKSIARSKWEKNTSWNLGHFPWSKFRRLSLNEFHQLLRLCQPKACGVFQGRKGQMSFCKTSLSRMHCPSLRLFMVNASSWTSARLPSPSLTQRVHQLPCWACWEKNNVREIASAVSFQCRTWGSASGLGCSLPLFPSTRVVTERLLLHGRQYLPWILPTCWIASFWHKMDAISCMRKQLRPGLQIASGAGPPK